MEMEKPAKDLKKEILAKVQAKKAKEEEEARLMEMAAQYEREEAQKAQCESQVLHAEKVYHEQCAKLEAKLAAEHKEEWGRYVDQLNRLRPKADRFKLKLLDPKYPVSIKLK